MGAPASRQTRSPAAEAETLLFVAAYPPAAANRPPLQPLRYHDAFCSEGDA